MGADAKRLKRRLKEAGLSDHAIAAAWPAWWSDEAAASPSARAELRFILSRRLGLAPRPLFDDRVEFVWKKDARFKHLTGEDAQEQAALASFGVALGRLLIRATESRPSVAHVTALSLRASILASRPLVDLAGLLAACWGLGIPVIHLRVFPLPAKRMHAMVVRVGDRYAVLLGRDASYPAPVAFWLAHELGHVALGHLRDASAVVDMADPAEAETRDAEEAEADAFGLELLTGTPTPDIRTDQVHFGPRQLAEAVLVVGPSERIEPGTLALCYAFRSGDWSRGTAALRHIYSLAKPVWREVNRIAASQLRFDAIEDEAADYLRAVIGLVDA